MKFEHLKSLSRKAVTAALLGSVAIAALPALASSHREAPMITQYPKVDNTDVYAFRSYEPGRSAFVTLIANFIPLQDSYGGPNYFTMDPDGIYEIHIDNNGDAREDITYQFKFKQTNKDIALNVGGKMVSIPLVNNGSRAVDGVFDGGLNVRETYNITAFRSSPTNTWKPVTNAANGAAFFDKPRSEHALLLRRTAR